MEEGHSPSSESAWSDEDVFHARRKFSRRSLVLGVTVSIAFLLHMVASNLRVRAKGFPLTPREQSQVETLETLILVVGLIAAFVGVLAIGAGLDYVQRRGRRLERTDDPI